jgi:hypothetical protein
VIPTQVLLLVCGIGKDWGFPQDERVRVTCQGPLELPCRYCFHDISALLLSYCAEKKRKFIESEIGWYR